MMRPSKSREKREFSSFFFFLLFYKALLRTQKNKIQLSDQTFECLISFLLYRGKEKIHSEIELIILQLKWYKSD